MKWPGLVVLLSVRAAAYWAPDHVSLNKQVFCDGTPWEDGFKRADTTVSRPLEYVRRVLYVSKVSSCTNQAGSLWGVNFRSNAAGLPGVDLPTDAPDAQDTVLHWNIKGGLWEDGFETLEEATAWGGRRAVNHFHDPLSATGAYTGITDANTFSTVPYLCLTRRGISATQWLMNLESGGSTNSWGLPTLIDSVGKTYFEKDTKKRQAGLAATLRVMGQLEHLIEDNSVPDHTRDLAHPGDGWEEYMAGPGSRFFRRTPKPWVVFPLKAVAEGGLRAIWDRDVYDGDNPQRTASTDDPPGISEFANANFYAWNLFTKYGLHQVFTTIPETENTGFVRTYGAALPSFQNLFTGVRENPASYPWPRWVSSSSAADSQVESAPGTLPLHIAVKQPDGDPLGESGVAWAQWTAPLMQHALGYAQTVISFAFQPGRAEVVPSPDGDPLKLSVRLWNLWPSDSKHAVTWHVDELKLVNVRKDKDSRPLPYADETPLELAAPFDVGPGQRFETQPLTVNWAQRFAFRNASHAAVVVKGHLGEGSHQTPLAFALPIPNAQVWIKQTEGVDLTGQFNNSTPDCDPDACTSRFENGFYWNPQVQRVKGTIELQAAEYDVFGRNADEQVKAAQKADARVAGVALVALSKFNTIEVVHPNQSTLTLTGAHLVPGDAPGVFVRSEAADDRPDEASIQFQADLDLKDFYRPDVGEPTVDANRASSTVFLMVWTTAGSIQLQRLMLWPWLNDKTAAAVRAQEMDSCDVTEVPHQPLLAENRGICSDSATMTSPCAGYTSTMKQVQFLPADPGLAYVTTTSFTDYIIVTNTSTEVRIKRLAGRTVQRGGDLDFPLQCDANLLANTWPAGNGEVMCGGFAPMGLALFSAANQTSASRCQMPPDPPSLPRTAEYEKIFRTAETVQLADTFNITTLPAPWTFTLSTQ